MKQTKFVMISSTILDLPEYRNQVRDACLRQEMMPLMMEYLPALNHDAVKASTEMVEKSDIYLLIIGIRYGYIPPDFEYSITELEYRYAMEMHKNCLVFVMSKECVSTSSNYEPIEIRQKFKAFKEDVLKRQVVNFFNSPADLRANVIHSLSHYRITDSSVHYITDIPTPPEPYIAHPYTLLHTQNLIGRNTELETISEWANKTNNIYLSPQVFSMISIGGLGKSALTWKWFNENIKKDVKNFDGRIWWSFYESDASFTNFVIRALAYITQAKTSDIEKLDATIRENYLIQILKKKNFLIVLDGLERILLAYARLDASRIMEDDLDNETNHLVKRTQGFSSHAQSFEGHSKLRRTFDPRAAFLLYRLSTEEHSSKILITSRLYPAILQDSITKEPIIGSYVYFLKGLTDIDALNLWRSFKVSGEDKDLLKLFNTFDNFPMLIRALAAEIASYRRAPRDFDQWKKDNPNFNPFELPLIHVKSHILSYALKGLKESSSRILHTIAAFRAPVTYDTLVALLVGSQKIFNNEIDLDIELTELEDRGLLGWLREGNRYDMHPIVRGITWSRAETREKTDIYKSIQSLFESVPTSLNWQEVKSVDELSRIIEYFSTLINLKRFENAYSLFHDSLNKVTLYKLSANRLRIELLESFFDKGKDDLPSLRNKFDTAFVLNALAVSYDCIGEYQEAKSVYNKLSSYISRYVDEHNLSICLSNFHETLRNMGNFVDAQEKVQEALSIVRKIRNYHNEAIILSKYGVLLTWIGKLDEAEEAFEKSIAYFKRGTTDHYFGVVYADYAHLRLLQNRIEDANLLIDKAINISKKYEYERDIIHVNRVTGQIYYISKYVDKAEKLLSQTLLKARKICYVEEELPCLIWLAKINIAKKEYKIAHLSLDEALEIATRGPFPIYQADIYSILSEFERESNRQDRSLYYAQKAFSISLNDDTNNSYYWGIKNAKDNMDMLESFNVIVDKQTKSKIKKFLDNFNK